MCEFVKVVATIGGEVLCPDHPAVGIELPSFEYSDPNGMPVVVRVVRDCTVLHAVHSGRDPFSEGLELHCICSCAPSYAAAATRADVVRCATAHYQCLEGGLDVLHLHDMSEAGDARFGESN